MSQLEEIYQGGGGWGSYSSYLSMPLTTPLGYDTFNIVLANVKEN